MARRGAQEAADKLRVSKSKNEKEVVKKQDSKKPNKSVNSKKANSTQTKKDAKSKKDAPAPRVTTTKTKATSTNNKKGSQTSNDTEATVSNDTSDFFKKSIPKSAATSTTTKPVSYWSDDDSSCSDDEENSDSDSDYCYDIYCSDSDVSDYCTECRCVHGIYGDAFRSNVDRFISDRFNYDDYYDDYEVEEDDDDDYDSELDSGMEEFSDRIASGGSAFIYALSVGAYLRSIFNDSNPIVRARITDFIRYSSTIDYSNVTQSFENFRIELSELTGNPLTNFPRFNPLGQSTPSGMSSADISRLPRHSYLGQTQKEKRLNEPAHKCCICMAELEVGEELILLDKCSHRFHSGCLESWLERSNQCPICRSVVNPPPILIN